MINNKQTLAKYLSPSESKTVKLEIPDFTNKMNAGQDEKVESPTFTIRGKDLRIQIWPNDRNDKVIGVYLHNRSEDTITAKLTVKNANNVKQTIFKRREIMSDRGYGVPNYTSHREYRWFLKSEDDVCRLEFEVTLYFTAEDLDCPKKRYPVSSN